MAQVAPESKRRKVRYLKSMNRKLLPNVVKRIKVLGEGEIIQLKIRSENFPKLRAGEGSLLQ
jgi:hypothetical protein